MKVALIQISDMHFRSINNKIDKKFKAFINRLSYQLSKNETVIFLLTGDITNSGREVEFNTTKSFFIDVKLELEKLNKNLKIYFELVPGNHDVDLSIEDDIRDATIGLVDNKKGNLSQKAIEYLFSFQSNFFNFANSINENYKEPFIFRTSKYLFDDFSIGIDCLNTSILSTLDENSNTLYLINFEDIKNKIKSIKHDFRILIMHHPLHWLNPSVRNEYIDFFNKNYDAIFFGHEHNLDEYQRTGIDCDITINSAGSFNDNETNESHFVIHKLDLNTLKYERQNYNWNNDIYIKINDDERPISFNNKGIKRLILNNDVLNEVNKLGIQIYKKDQLDLFCLDDLFTIPKYEVIKSINDIKDGIDSKVPSFDELLKINYLLIIGEFRSGKSTLLNKIFKNEYYQKRKPIIFSGVEIKEHSISFYEKVLSNKIAEHYGIEQLNTYTSLNIQDRTLIIDDIHKMKYFDDHFIEFIEFAKNKFGKIVISLNYDEFNKLRLENKEIVNFYQLVLREFQHEERLKLYVNWYDHFSETSKDEKLINIELAENTIDAIIGNKLIRSTPETITLLLYQIKSITQTDSDIYGKLYDFIIMKSLNTLNLPELEIKIILKLLYVVAFKMFQNNTKSISTELLRETIREFSKYYLNNLDYEKTIKILIDCNVFKKMDSETFVFEYTFYYYYLLSKYLVESLDSPELYIDEQINNLFKEDSFNLLVFYCYVGDTKYLFSKLREISDNLFKENKVIDLKQKFNENIVFNFGEIKDSLECDKTYDEIRERKIEIVRRKDELEEKNRNTIYENDEFSNTVLKLIRVNQLLGVIINSYGGTIPSNELIPTIGSVYRMNFRFLDFLLSDSGKLGRLLMNSLKENIENEIDRAKNEKKLKKLVNSLLYQIYITYTLFTIEITSTALSSSIYVDKYSEFKDEFLFDTNVQLIQSCIKLVHLHTNSIMSAINLSDKYYEEGDYHLIVFLRIFCNEYFNHRSLPKDALKEKYINSKIRKRIEIKFDEVND